MAWLQRLAQELARTSPRHSAKWAIHSHFHSPSYSDMRKTASHPMLPLSVQGRECCVHLTRLHSVAEFSQGEGNGG